MIQELELQIVPRDGRSYNEDRGIQFCGQIHVFRMLAFYNIKTQNN